MHGPRRSPRPARAAVVASVLACLVLGACSARTASYDDTRTIPPPAFAAAPASPGESPQLAALELGERVRPTTEPDSDPALLPGALAALDVALPGVERLTDLYFDDGHVWITAVDPADPEQLQSFLYAPGGSSLSPQGYVEDDTESYPIGLVRPDVVTDLVPALAALHPDLQVGTVRLDSGLSYELGLSWRIELNDARGAVAVVWADLDGTVTAVDVEER